MQEKKKKNRPCVSAVLRFSRFPGGGKDHSSVTCDYISNLVPDEAPTAVRHVNHDLAVLFFLRRAKRYCGLHLTAALGKV